MVFKVMNPAFLFFDQSQAECYIVPGVSYEDTDIYKYYLNHTDIDTLEKIIIESKKSVYLDDFLKLCYTALLDKKMDQIIFEVITGNNSNDELMICLLAIKRERYDIIEYLLSKGFNLNQMVSAYNIKFFDFDILSYTVRKNNLKMIKFLVDRGANPIENNLMALITACGFETDDAFRYFLSLELPDSVLYKIFLHCCNVSCCNVSVRDNVQKLNIILRKGIDIKNIQSELNDIIGICDLDVVQFIINNGHVINTNLPLVQACEKSNAPVIDYLLNYGLQPDENIIEKVLSIFHLPTIEIFINHKINMRNSIKPNKHINLVNKLEVCGLDKDGLIFYLFNKLLSK
ncbi:mg215 protein [Tupanvirus deep ocean]|uniref:Mg215 protein n=2 Tax=Tupanvirus TaxID=2094720 RepID=A0AC62A7Q7_9VIRU|nr:mg215 protein [Tupanvirus deep ocean]QKU33815.1 mg215 protein [Tupanvirus deep ocean]